MATLPDFQKDITGEYTGNAYPEQHLYRIHMEQTGDGTQFRIWAEWSDGGFVGEYKFDDTIAEDGIVAMAQTNHGLDGYEDDWHLPDGMYRSLHWRLPGMQSDIDLTLDETAIDEVSAWLCYALGLAEYDGGDEWEY